ncbi:copper resistance protein CopC [Mesorhizobium sp. M7A.F.Ca.CA.001.09.2.1]|uniref:Copper resistance protein CopC n=5 Tax=Mesorhizobium TaxID=68287 RepID=A0AB38TG48_9HYPH|nr:MULTISPECIES: copper resistance CopC/CopD family protein [Mesorhizobium]MDF3215885.1 copper resistance CopC/CopD family protein [Mesorhizobium ciceri]RUY60927.1 copper resistance protein CopC [Mesorhizobium sp. M7A.F.Ca.CA.001.05.1.1]RUY67897.1 copper resistance protein CopC [Mesorhizobium sp. M7A.F.Ca.CA.001.09.2.1]RUY69642.1 copper resistance protein CopC [Mesorhizobium sp. M7A.F.Ca.CA.001.13.1.1]RUZ04537.1 copper resistance protein CopC [Mesorhizobium sp. M7A.F.Ca.CA.001.04.2.1]
MSTTSLLQTACMTGKRTGRLAVGLLAVIVFLASLAVSDQAFAHAALIKTDPADGAVLAQGPAQFSLTFSEPVSPLVLTLVKPDGKPVPLTAFRLSDQTVEIDNPQPLKSGTHVLSWRVISADGHPVGGSLLFSIGAPSEPPAVSEAVDWPLRSAIWASKIFLYVGLFLGVGGAFALAWLAGSARAGQRFVAAAILSGLVASSLSLGLQGLDALGAPLSHLAQSVIWRTGLGTSFGWTVLVALIALGLGLLSLAGPRATAKPLALAGLAGVGIALAASGHASAAEPQWLTRPMVFLHGVCIASWVGALVPLGLALKGQSAEATPFLRRFSWAILPVVAVLAAAGTVLAVIQVQTPAALVDTAYGRLLLIKLGLLVFLFTLAAVNRWKLTASAEAGSTEVQRRLVRSIGVEMLIVLAIFGVAAGWRFTPPPRALAIAAAQPVSVHIHALQAMADLNFTPGHAGPVVASMVIMSGDFGPLDAKEVTLVLSKPDSGIEPLKRTATKPGDGSWRVDNLVIPVPGRWTVRIDILVSDFQMVKIEAPVDIRP